MIRIKPIVNVLGVMLLAVGIMMASAIPFSVYYKTGNAKSFLTACIVTIGAGVLMRYFRFRENTDVNKREGYMIVVLGWVSMIIFSSLPYLFTQSVPEITNAIFEVASGMTTTGASILTDIESMPRDILYWRSMTQWIGGMGIIVLTVAIFPILRLGGNDLFGAEAPGPTSEKIHPRIRATAKSLWYLYVGITLSLMLILWISGMTFFDAINHALTCMATGGFSTKNASIAAFAPHIQYILTFFMFLAGTNYLIIYLSVTGKLRRAFKSEEFRVYGASVLTLTILFTTVLYFTTNIDLEQSFRDSIFQIVSLITTTGFVSADYSTWHQAIFYICFLLLFMGGCAGSTAGGIKVIRHIIYVKNTFNEFKRLLHPRAVLPLRVDGKVVQSKIVFHVQVFFLLFVGIYIFSVFILMAIGIDFETALGAAATSLGNVGPGIGNVGPVDNFAWLPSSAKIYLSFIMVVGRLELFTVLVLFTPYFWREH